MASPRSETLEVCAGDVLLTAAPARFDILVDPVGYDSELPASLVEKPDEITTLVFRGQSFALRTRMSDCYSNLRTVHALHGGSGLDRFFRENGFIEKTRRSGPEIETQSPDDPGMPRRDLFLLLKEAERCIRRQTKTAIGLVQPLALEHARQRLDKVRAAVELEAVRYFRSIDTPSRARDVLGSDVAGWGYLIDQDSLQVQGLLQALVRLQPALTASRKADKALADAVETVSAIRAGLSDLRNKILVDDRQAHEAILRELETAVAKRETELPALQQSAKDGRDALVADLKLATVEYPVLWRIYATRHSAQPIELGREILAALRDVWQANVELLARIESDVEELWMLPAVVRGVLDEHNVAVFSLIGTAVEERLEDVGGMRSAQAVAATAGLTHLGLIGLAALAGSGPIGAPVAIGLFVVEAVASLIDAVQEYGVFRLNSAAFRATLDPSEALAVEPSTFMAVFAIGMDLLALAAPPARLVK